MVDSAGQEPPQPIQFVAADGSPLIVGPRDRGQRIRDAVSDLQVVVDGCTAPPNKRPEEQAASLARHCSIFLRKLVLDDRNNQRLLDDDFCRTVGLRFDRLWRMSGDRRTLTIVPVSSSGGFMQFTKLSDETGQPEATHRLPIGPQRVTFDIEWPLPGMADWRSQPTPEEPWKIRPEALFDSNLSPSPDCDAWLGQQLVLFDARGIALKDVIRVLANTEGAHSPPMDRLMLPQGTDDNARFRVIRDGEIHILSHILVCGVRYSHVVVIEAAMFLYRQLTQNESVDTPEGAGKIPSFRFAPESAFADGQEWLRFSGGLVLSIGGGGQSITHRIRPPG
ncbi:MAG: hypothetical protein OXS47_12225 [Chloroflexota bacterium]|nr:hypothetical protein [Chloroflexota bacterium]